MADDLADLASQAQAAETSEQDDAKQGLGALDVKQEQDGYQQQIDAQNQQRQIVNHPTPVPSTLDNVEATAGDVGHRAWDVVKGAVAGPIAASGEMAQSIAKLALLNGPLSGITNTTGWQVISKMTNDPQTKAFADQQVAQGQALVNTVENPIKAVEAAETPKVDTVGGQLAQGVTQFAVGFAGLLHGEPEGLALGARMAYRAVAGGLTQAAAFNPDDPRLSNLIQEHPALKNPVTDFLASKPGDDEAVGRLKNFLEGTVLSGAGEAVTEAFTHILTGMRASGSIAETTKGLQDAKPSEVPPSAPEPAASSPEDRSPQPNEEGAPQAPAASGAPYEPPRVDGADTAHPTAGGTQTPEVEPEVPAGEAEKGTSAAAEPPPEPFNPQEAAKKFFSVDPDKAKTVLGYLTDGRYADIPGVLEDTHRTIPWDSLSDGANMKGLFNAVEANFGDLIRKNAGVGVVPDSAVQQLAKDIGGNVDAVTKLYQDTTGGNGLAARITAGYNIMMASARRLKDLAETAHSLNAETEGGQKAILDFQKQLELHGAIVGQVRRSSSEIGRALHAHRTLKASSDVALQNITELAGTTLGPRAIKKFLAGVRDGDLSDVNAAADKLRGRGLMGVIRETAQGGMLSGPATQIANIVGNTVNAIIKAGERYVAAGIGSVRGVLMPNAEVMTARAAMAHTTGLIAGVRDSFPLFVKALAHEQDVSAAGRPLTRSIYMNPEGLTGARLTIAQVINRVGQAVRYPGRFMGAIDNLNMGMGYQADLQSRSYLQSASEADAQGLTDNARDAFMTKRMQELRTNPPPDVKAKSMDAGLYQSFQEAPKTRFGEGISNLLNSHPLVKLLIAPFVHRPLNMLRQSLMDYTPLGLTSKTARATIGAGDADSDLALARMAIGTGALAYGYHLAGSGNLTGERLGANNTENLDGIPRDAIKIGGTWHQFNRLDPVGTWLAVSADLHEAIQRAYDPNDNDRLDQFAQAARAATQVVGAAAMDKSFMQSVSQVLDVVGNKDPKRADVLMQRLVDSNLTKFVPFSGALRAVSHEQDPTERVSGGDGLSHLWDSIKANLPVLSKELPPKRDLLGRPVQYPGGDNGWWNPFAGTTAAADNMDQELSKLAVAVKSPPRTLAGITLAPEQYDEVQRLATQTPMFRDENLEGYLRTLTSSDEWKSYESTDDHGIKAHTQMVQEAVDAAYDYAKSAYMDSPAHKGFLQAMQANAQAQAKHFMRQ